jgi:hypothetical protein
MKPAVLEGGTDGDAAADGEAATGGSVGAGVRFIIATTRTAVMATAAKASHTHRGRPRDGAGGDATFL